MAITSSSTLTDVLAQYNDNLSWDGDIAKAKLEAGAIRWILGNRAESGSRAGRTWNYANLEKELDRITAFITSQTSPVKNGSRRGFRISHFRPGGSR